MFHSWSLYINSPECILVYAKMHCLNFCTHKLYCQPQLSPLQKSKCLVVSSHLRVNVPFFIGLGRCGINVRSPVALDDRALLLWVGGLGFDTTNGNKRLGVFKKRIWYWTSSVHVHKTSDKLQMVTVCISLGLNSEMESKQTRWQWIGSCVKMD